MVICHGFKGFKDWGFFPYLAERLARAGLAAVSFNFSGSGVGEDPETFDELERFGRNTYTSELRDLEIVLEAFVSGALGVGPAVYGLFGHSMGGSICVLRAAADDRARALVTWAAVARFGGLWRREQIAEWRRTGRLDVVNQRTGQVLPLYTDMLDDLERWGAEKLNVRRAAEEVRAPWLIIHGANDESVPAEDGRDLHRAARPGTAELLLVEGAGHTLNAKHPWPGSNPELERAVRATVEWFGKQLT